MDHEKDTFLVLGCDGVFELLRNQDVVDFCHENLLAGRSLANTVEELLSQCISPNLLVTQGKGGDNVSAILVRLPATTNASSTNASAAASSTEEAAPGRVNKKDD